MIDGCTSKFMLHVLGSFVNVICMGTETLAVSLSVYTDVLVFSLTCIYLYLYCESCSAMVLCLPHFIELMLTIDGVIRTYTHM